MVKALKVSIDGKLVGVYVPAAGEVFSAMLANVPKTYMRAQVFGGSANESWQWQLPDIKEGQVISFEMVEALEGSGVPPHRVTKIEPAEAEENKRLAKEMYAKVRQERQPKKEQSTQET